MSTRTRHGSIGEAQNEINVADDGSAKVRVRRAFPAGLKPSTAREVWRIASDFAAIKVLFPTLLSVYVTYPDASNTVLQMVRHMTFAPPAGSKNQSFGIEKLIELDERKRRLVYVSVLGLPVTDYRSEMLVTGDDACQLTWTSSCRVTAENEAFLDTLALILCSGANQIATALGIR